MRRADTKAVHQRPPDLLRIGAVARESGCSVQSLRFYESRGLIEPAQRTESGYRLYSRAVFERLEFIRKAQSAGFRLDEIARIVAIADAGARPCQEVRRMTTERLEEIEKKLVELMAMRDRLKTVVERWQAVGEADGKVCGLIESLANGEEE